VVQSEQVRDRADGQDIGIEVDDLGELSEPERVKFGEGGVEIRSSCRGGSESSLSERVRYQSGWVGRGSPIGPSNVLMVTATCMEIKS